MNPIVSTLTDSPVVVDDGSLGLLHIVDPLLFPFTVCDLILFGESSAIITSVSIHIQKMNKNYYEQYYICEYGDVDVRNVPMSSEITSTLVDDFLGVSKQLVSV